MTARPGRALRPPPPNDRGRSALVLSGGGITGFLYEVGLLMGLEERGAGSFQAGGFDVYVGTSAGAVLAALLANGAPIAGIFRDLHAENERSPFFFRQQDLFGVGARGPLSLITQFLKPLWGTLQRALRARRRPSLAEVLADFQAHHPPGFYSTEPLQHTLCARFSALGYPHSFDELERELYVAGTDLDTGERLLFGADEFERFHICHAVAASCAIPIFFRPIRIGDRDVVDGAIAGRGLFEVALRQGARRILCLNPLVPLENDRSRVCLPLDGGHCARISEKGVGWIGEQALRLLFAQALEADCEALRARAPGVVLLVLSPPRDEISMFMRGVLELDGARAVLEYGRQSAFRLLEPSESEELAAFFDEPPY